MDSRKCELLSKKQMVTKLKTRILEISSDKSSIKIRPKGSIKLFSSTAREDEDCDEHWTGLTKEERAAAEMLGYTHATWESFTDPPSLQLSWAQLSKCGDAFSSGPRLIFTHVLTSFSPSTSLTPSSSLPLTERRLTFVHRHSVPRSP